ncbi:MAG: transcriptional repressor LexA [Bacillota bacterium]
MNNRLTRRQREILDAIERFTREHGYSPSVRDIGAAVGLTSSATVHNHLKRLRMKGFIDWDFAKPRTVGLTARKGTGNVSGPSAVYLPVLGRVTAGQPILAAENFEEMLPVPWDMIRGDEGFILKVRGDSMVEAGIFDGDHVVVRKQETAENGDIVVALLEDEVTVKRFFKEKNNVRLQPENPDYDPIIARDVQILGKVTAVFRRLP